MAVPILGHPIICSDSVMEPGLEPVLTGQVETASRAVNRISCIDLDLKSTLVQVSAY